MLLKDLWVASLKLTMYEANISWSCIIIPFLFPLWSVFLLLFNFTTNEAHSPLKTKNTHKRRCILVGYYWRLLQFSVSHDNVNKLICLTKGFCIWALVMDLLSLLSPLRLHSQNLFREVHLKFTLINNLVYKFCWSWNCWKMYMMMTIFLSRPHLIKLNTPLLFPWKKKRQ